jgi:hypothetical protein
MYRPNTQEYRTNDLCNAHIQNHLTCYLKSAPSPRGIKEAYLHERRRRDVWLLVDNLQRTENGRVIEEKFLFSSYYRDLVQ